MSHVPFQTKPFPAVPTGKASPSISLSLAASTKAHTSGVSPLHHTIAPLSFLMPPSSLSLWVEASVLSHFAMSLHFKLRMRSREMIIY